MMGLGFLRNCISSLVYKATPVQKNKYVFTSFNGHYSDNPKYICEALHAQSPQAQIVWLVNPAYISDVPSYAKAVNIGSKKAFWHRASARAIIDNVYGERENNLIYGDRKAKFKIKTFLKKKGSQDVFTTWHGTPLKKMGIDQHASTVCDFSCPDTTMILGNQFTLDIMDHLTFHKLDMQLLGTPRNDILFQGSEQIAKVKAQLGLPADKKVILFAPTFRTDGSNIADKNIARSGINQLEEMDFDLLFETLAQKFGGDWVLVCRFHYHVEKMVDWDALEQQYPGRIINGNRHDDMAQYLLCTDVLLTDASSSMFDFSLTKKPCFLFFPDLEYYGSEERGFYGNVEDLPYPCAVDFKGLLDAIRHFDSAQYAQKTDRLLNDYGFVDDCQSSERVANFILARCKK